MANGDKDGDDDQSAEPKSIHSLSRICSPALDSSNPTSSCSMPSAQLKTSVNWMQQFSSEIASIERTLVLSSFQLRPGKSQSGMDDIQKTWTRSQLTSPSLVTCANQEFKEKLKLSFIFYLNVLSLRRLIPDVIVLGVFNKLYQIPNFFKNNNENN